MTDYATYREVLRTMPPEPYHTPADVDCRVSANVGDLMAAALAAAGSFAIVTGEAQPSTRRSCYAMRSSAWRGAWAASNTSIRPS